MIAFLWKLIVGSFEHRDDSWEIHDHKLVYQDDNKLPSYTKYILKNKRNGKLKVFKAR